MANIFSEDNTVGENHPLASLLRLLQGDFRSRYGWDFHIASRIPQILRDIGFVNIEERHNYIPIGRWHPEAREREMGMFNRIIWMEWSTAMLANREAIGLGEDEAARFTQELEDAFDDASIHAQNDYIECWAQKPYP